MATPNKAMPSEQQVKTIYQVAIMFAKRFKDESQNWKDKRPLVLGGISIIALGLLGTVGYFIMEHRIAPLLIFVATMIPVLAIGLNEANKSLEHIKAEFLKYNEAMTKVLASIVTAASCNADDVIRAMAASVIVIAKHDVHNADEVTYGDMRQHSEFKSAVVFAKMLVSAADAVETLKKQGLDVAELLDNVDFAYSAEEYDSFLKENADLLDNLTGYQSEHGGAQIDPKPFVPDADVKSEDNPHIINAEGEDLNLTV